MDSLTLEHLPTDCIVHIALFKNIKNAAFLHSQLLARNADFEYAFIDASIVSEISSGFSWSGAHGQLTVKQVVSRRQLLAAAYKSINALLNDSLLTPNVHSEIVVNLNPSTNVRFPHFPKLSSSNMQARKQRSPHT